MDAYSRSYTSESRHILGSKSEFQPINPRVLKLEDLVLTGGVPELEKRAEFPNKHVTNS